MLGLESLSGLPVAAFEEAVRQALGKPLKSGTKWRELELLFLQRGVRVSAAIASTHADRHARVRQMLCPRRHGGRGGSAKYPDFGVLVLAGKADDSWRDEGLISLLRDEWKCTGSEEDTAGLAVFSWVEGAFAPLMLLVARDTPVTKWFASGFRFDRRLSYEF